MLGLDDKIAGLADGGSLWAVVAVAVLLGLRHATDPDHIAAVSALVARNATDAPRRAGELGVAWGVGHATTLVAFGLPVLLIDEYLPDVVERLAETAVALVIAYLAVRLLLRSRDRLHVHAHEHDGVRHVHLHTHRHTERHVHVHRIRSRRGAFGIGLMHGLGGSAGVGILLVASAPSDATAVVALVVLAVCTAVAMTLLSTGFGLTLAKGTTRVAVADVGLICGVATLAFSVWYGAAAWGLVPYPF